MPLNITSASGKGAVMGMGEWGDDDLIVDVERPTPAASLIVNDWFWGGGPPDPTIIPWTWLQAPIELRADQPINSAAVTRINQAAVTVGSPASQTTYGVFAVATSIDTILPGDAANLAAFLTTYYANPLMRCPTITLSLVPRTDEERWRILGREIGDRIVLGPGTVQDAAGHTAILPVPAGLPAGARSLVIEGIAHASSVTDRTVEWTTAPLLGISANLQDTFTRSVSNGLGSPTVGPAWANAAISAGTDSQISVNGTSGQHAHASFPMFIINSVPALVTPNADAAITVSISSTATYGEAHIYLRYADTSNWYRVMYDLGGAALYLQRTVAGVSANLAGPVAGPSPTTSPLRLRCAVSGTALMAKVWLASTPEPAAWMATATDTALSSGMPAIGSFGDIALKTWTWDDAIVYTGANPQNVEGPWFRTGTSRLDGVDAMPF